MGRKCGKRNITLKVTKIKPGKNEDIINDLPSVLDISSNINIHPWTT
jgi:hypothetical protein